MWLRRRVENRWPQRGKQFRPTFGAEPRDGLEIWILQQRVALQRLLGEVPVAGFEERNPDAVTLGCRLDKFYEGLGGFGPLLSGLIGQSLPQMKLPGVLFRFGVLPSKFRLALLVIALGFAGNGFAKSSPPVGEITLDLDRPACKIEFSLGAALHTVRGTFEVEEGTLRLDVASRKISGQVVVDVLGDTGDDERDRRMHREVLESTLYPEALFSPDRLTGQLALPGQSDVASVHTVRGMANVVLPLSANLIIPWWRVARRGVRFSEPLPSSRRRGRASAG